MDTGAIALVLAIVVILAMLATTVPRIREVREERHHLKAHDEQYHARGR
jgi:hypothetical protein